jgi:hypothetical protein
MVELLNHIIECPSCHQQLRIPTDRGRLKVGCPSCRTSWDWSPATKSTPSKEYRYLSFRCAQEGQLFHVVFSREASSHIFRITQIRSTSQVGSVTQADSSAQSFDATEFDYSGWECPCCGYAKSGDVDPLFVQCSTCGECVCGSRVQRIDGGGMTFVCHDGCGGSGRIEGQISSYYGQSTVASNDQAVVLSSARNVGFRNR